MLLYVIALANTYSTLCRVKSTVVNIEYEVMFVLVGYFWESYWFCGMRFSFCSTFMLLSALFERRNAPNSFKKKRKSDKTVYNAVGTNLGIQFDSRHWLVNYSIYIISTLNPQILCKCFMLHRCLLALSFQVTIALVKITGS